MITEQDKSTVILNKALVSGGRLADVIWQGCKGLIAEFNDTDDKTRKEYLRGCLCDGLFFHSLVLGNQKEQAKKQAEERTNLYLEKKGGAA